MHLYLQTCSTQSHGEEAKRERGLRNWRGCGNLPPYQQAVLPWACAPCGVPSHHFQWFISDLQLSQEPLPSLFSPPLLMSFLFSSSPCGHLTASPLPTCEVYMLKSQILSPGSISTAGLGLSHLCSSGFHLSEPSLRLVDFLVDFRPLRCHRSEELNFHKSSRIQKSA